MELIPPLLLGIVFLSAAIIMFWRKQYEHAFTRMVLAGFYFYIYFIPATSIEVTRMLARYFLLLMGVIEVISYIVRKLWGKSNE
jgi:uncharacterized membrane protein